MYALLTAASSSHDTVQNIKFLLLGNFMELYGTYGTNGKALQIKYLRLAARHKPRLATFDRELYVRHAAQKTGIGVLVAY